MNHFGKALEFLAVVGESGSGKTTLARTVAQLVTPTSGEILLDGRDLREVSRKDVYRNMQIVFQDPDSSLDPRRTIADTIGEPIRGLLGGSKESVEDKVLKSLTAVGLSLKNRPTAFRSNSVADNAKGSRLREQ